MELLKKHLIFISLAFIIGVSLSSVQGISPFTEIGNLEMETLDALNMIVEDLNAEIIRIDSLNATEISEQLEQDGMQIDISNLQVNQIEALANIEALQGQTKIMLDGRFGVPGLGVSPTKERGVNGTIPNTFIPIIVDFEFTSFQNNIRFTNGTVVKIPGPHLLPSFYNSLDMFFKERIADGTIVNHPLCSLTVGDSISECDLIGWNSTVIPQSPTVAYLVDSNADPNIYTIFDYEGIFKITITHP